MNNTLKSILIWSLFTLYTYFSYHLLVIPAFLDFSVLGIIGVCLGVGLLLWLVPSYNRKNTIITLLAILLLDKAIANASEIENLLIYVLSVVFIIFVIGLVSLFYGKASIKQIATFTIIVLLFSVLFSRSEVRLLGHLNKVWESPELYAGKVFDYFPIEIMDVNNDGKDEIITFGNLEEVKENLEENEENNKASYFLKEEPVFPYVFSWDGSEMKRIPIENLDTHTLNSILVKDFVGFPYYSFELNKELTPLESRQAIIEKSMMVGNSPFLAMELTVRGLNQIYDQFDKKTSIKGSFKNSSFQDVTIKNGVISGIFKGEPFQSTTYKTRIIGSVHIEGEEYLALLGKDFGLYKVANSGLNQTHSLTNADFPNLVISEFIIADVDNDQIDELLITMNGGSILKPTSTGNWKYLWKSKDSSFRFEAYESVNKNEQSEILALAKSEVRNHPLRFLAGFEYTEQGLKRKWKTLLSFINVKVGDINGDQKDEIIASIYQSHKIYVFNKHNIPVQLFLIVITGLLIVYGTLRRIRHGQR